MDQSTKHRLLIWLMQLAGRISPQEIEEFNSILKDSEPPTLAEGHPYNMLGSVTLTPQDQLFPEGVIPHDFVAELEQKLDFQPSPAITLPAGTDPHDWPSVAPFLRRAGVLAPLNHLYTFSYELPEGKRGSQDIIAASLDDAFKHFGWVMEQFKLHPSNITYGIEMEHQAPAIADQAGEITLNFPPEVERALQPGEDPQPLIDFLHQVPAKEE